MNKSEVARLYDSYAQGIYGFLLSLVHLEADARDLLQDVFVKIARNDGCLASIEHEKAFLFKVARNAAIDHSRRIATRSRKERDFHMACSELFAVDSDPDALEFRESLANALGQLPEEQRSVVYLKLWQNETFEQIAIICDLSPNTAASRYRYGIEKLRSHLRPIYNEIIE